MATADSLLTSAHPILSCDETKQFEAGLFGGDEAKEWSAMQTAGNAVGVAVLRDFQELGGFPGAGRVLVLAGKGHNGGDALLAAKRVATDFPAARVDVLFASGEHRLRPLALRSWQALRHAAPARVTVVRREELAAAYDLVLDGVFGFQFHPPLAPELATLFAEVNSLATGLRAAVDLPSGLGEPGAFQADFTYATGVVKTPLLVLPNAGRLRYLDLGFDTDRAFPQAPQRVLTPAVLTCLRTWRPPRSDKRTYGHLAVLGGSRRYPGAVLMSVRAAVRSGTGLVTAF
ncbi:MAG TPA: NAD(P)H-hydrate epimerase, partial [Opitutaceae bacterium]